MPNRSRKSIVLHGLASLLPIVGVLAAFSTLAAPQRPYYNAPPPPPGSDRGSPSRQTDMGTRSPCGSNPSADSFLTALIPKSSPALTVSARPTFWVYVPYAASDIESIEFSLEQEGSPVSIILTPPDRPGIISIALPDDVPPLELGQRYQWSISVTCRNAEPGDSRFVEGSIQRVAIEPALSNALETASPREQAALYAEHGIWYDALNTLGNLYRNQPENAQIRSDWATLLAALEIDLRDRGINFGTSNIVNSPIVN